MEGKRDAWKESATEAGIYGHTKEKVDKQAALGAYYRPPGLVTTGKRRRGGEEGRGEEGRGGVRRGKEGRGECHRGGDLWSYEREGR